MEQLTEKQSGNPNLPGYLRIRKTEVCILFFLLLFLSGIFVANCLILELNSKMVRNMGKLVQNMERILNRSEGMTTSREEETKEGEKTLDFSQKRRRLKKFLEIE